MSHHVRAKDKYFEEHPMGQLDLVFQQPQCHLYIDVHIDGHYVHNIDRLTCDQWSQH